MMELLEFDFIGDLGGYWRIFRSYVDVLLFLKWAVIGGVIGFAVVLILEIILRKKILVRRRYKILKYIAYAYFLFFPFYAGFCSSQWFALHNVEKQMIKHIPEVLGNTNTILNNYLKSYATSWLGDKGLNITTNEGVDSTVELVMGLIDSFTSKKDSTASESKNIASTITKLLKSEYMKGKTKGEIADYLSSATGIDKVLIEDLMDTELQTILDTGAANALMEAKIKSIFGGLKWQIVIMFLIGMAIPISEIILAHYLEKKRREEEALQEIGVDDGMNNRN